MVMQEPFPVLRHLFLVAHISNDVPVLSSEFLGKFVPCLQTIELVGISFPSLAALLLSTTSYLVTLRLFNIPQNGYILPEAMVAILATLTRLKGLRLGFQSSCSSSRGDQLRLPPVTRTLLVFFEVCVVRRYLADFATRVDASPIISLAWI